MNIYDLDIYRYNVEYANQHEVSRVIEVQFVQDLTGRQVVCDITNRDGIKVRHNCEYDPNTHVVSFVLAYSLTKVATTYTGQFVVTMPNYVNKTCDFQIVVNPSVVTNQEQYDANEIQMTEMRGDIANFKRTTNQTVTNLSNGIDTFERNVSQDVTTMQNDHTQFKNDVNRTNTQFQQGMETDYGAFKEEVRDMKPTFPAPNLLINSDFRIWQRGDSVTVTNDGNYHYTADRWCTKSAATFTKVADGLQTNAYATLCQFIPKLKRNKTYTISCSIDGYIYKETFTTNGYGHAGTYLGYDTSKESSGWSGITVNLSAGQTLNWVKLEMNNQATDYVPRSYALEEIDCLRYFVHFKGSIHPSAVNATQVWGSIPLVVNLANSYPKFVLKEGTAVKRQDGTASVDATEIGGEGVADGGRTVTYNLTTSNIAWRNEPVFVDMNCWIDAEVY